MLVKYFEKNIFLTKYGGYFYGNISNFISCLILSIRIRGANCGGVGGFLGFFLFSNKQANKQNTQQIKQTIKFMQEIFSTIGSGSNTHFFVLVFRIC